MGEETQHSSPVRLARAIGKDGLTLGIALSILYAATPALATHIGIDTPDQALAGTVLCAALVTLSIIDIKTLRLPDILTLPLIALGVALSVANGVGALAWASLSAGVAYFAMEGLRLFYQRWRGRHGLGRGDAKLLAAAGAWVGLEGIASVLLVASVTALLAAGIAHALGREISRTTALPFGPFLSFGLWLAWLFGPLALTGAPGAV